jgi:co-chaperonin GroES (HSP10)
VSELQARNTLVSVEIEDAKETMVGQLLVPTQKKEYCVGVVLNVGPGNVVSEGGRSETADLKVGDRVLVRHQLPQRGPAGGTVFRSTGIELEKSEGKKIVLFEQAEIIGIYVGVDVPTLIEG